jgi:hypothetical protein
MSCALNLIFTFLLLSFGRYFCWWTIVPEDIFRPVVSASALTWFIIYIYYWNLQFLNNVIINKTKVLLPQALVTVANNKTKVLLPQALVTVANNKTKVLLPQALVTVANNKTKVLLPQALVTVADFGYPV